MRKITTPTDKVDITLMSRAQGVSLDKIWNTLSLPQKLNYKDQLATILKSLRQSTSTLPQDVLGRALNDCLIGHCQRRTAPTCRKIGRTTDEWFKNLEEDLRFGLSLIHKTKNKSVIEKKYQELIRGFPQLEPYVLTYGDLNFTNIIVHNEKIEAIIDWEYSGYFPW